MKILKLARCVFDDYEIQYSIYTVPIDASGNPQACFPLGEFVRVSREKAT